MNFEHLVEINNDSLPVDDISRQQLWRGLVLRAEKPELSVVGLDECRILERQESRLHRQLRFGSFVICDRVRFFPMRYVIYEVEATSKTPASSLTMAIEEPSAGRLFVRFSYATQQAETDSDLDRFYVDHIKQAYIQADMDTVATIRRLAQEGALDDHGTAPLS